MLTDTRIEELWYQHPASVPFARAIESESLQAQEPVAFPIPPEGIIAHPNLGELYDRLQMQQYAMKYATLYTSPQPPAPCPTCKEEQAALEDSATQACDWRRRFMAMTSECDTLQAKVAELETFKTMWAMSCAEYDALQAKIVEIESIAKHRKTLCDEWAEINKAEITHNLELQAKVIEKDALIKLAEKFAYDIPGNGSLLGFVSDSARIELLAAIEAHKKGDTN